MNLITKSLLPQLINKNLIFRPICSNAFEAVIESNSHRIDATLNRHGACSRCQRPELLAAPTTFHTPFSQMISVRSYASNEAKTSKFMGKLKKAFGLSSESRNYVLRAGYLLYEEVADKIEYSKFVTQFSKANTFYSWFLVTEIHVWMLMVRAMGDDGPSGRILRNAIVEAMWKDVELRAKKLGHTNSKKLRAEVCELGHQFEYALIAYDEGLLSDDKQLASAVWNQFFDTKCDDYVQIELMVKYIRENIAMLDTLSRDEFVVQRKIPWTNLTEPRL